MEFQLKADQEYIQLNNLLQVVQVAQTGGHAKIIIKNEDVTLNGEVELQIRKKIRKGDKIKIEELVINII